MPDFLILIAVAVAFVVVLSTALWAIAAATGGTDVDRMESRR